MGISADVIVEFMSDELAIDMSDINYQTLLFSTGIIDSFALITLVTFLERQCGFRMSPMDVNLENLDSIERILSYIERTTAD